MKLRRSVDVVVGDREAPFPETCNASHLREKVFHQLLENKKQLTSQEERKCVIVAFMRIVDKKNKKHFTSELEILFGFCFKKKG